MGKRKRGEGGAKSKARSEADDAGKSEVTAPKDATITANTNESQKPERFEILHEGKTIICERKGSGQHPALVCTHGAGGTIDAPALQEFLQGVPSYVCFQGSMNLKSRVKSFHAVVEHSSARQALGGRSMGARAAVIAALEMTDKPTALVLVSYPLTAAGKQGPERQPDQREKILLDLPASIDVLFAIGSEDHQCDLDLLRDTVGGMKAKTWLLELKGADHGTSLKQKAGVQPMRSEVGTVAAAWLATRDEANRYCSLAWDQTEGRIVTQGWEDSTESAQSGAKRKKKKT